MAASERQNRLLIAEDWKRIYQSYRNADFQSYDFENLKRTMINYLRQNYPEDFNDYIESSEYLALIDMIAFLGQNLSFRIDLNARENFLETAERRESILRLARMLSYNPRRNQAANGLLQINSVKTTENILDSSGIDLSGSVIRWNDNANPNFFEQFVKVLNSSLPVTNMIGSPLKTENIEGVQTQKYRFNAVNNDISVFPFQKTIEGVGTKFEVVSTDFDNGSIREEPPIPGNSPSFLFRDDGQGASSNNTGFFMHFRQGKLDSGGFTVSNSLPNQVIAVDSGNINDTDVWLYSVDTNGFETVRWKKLNNVEGNNIIYNSLFRGDRNVYSVTSRIGDRINLVFSDGVFGNLPRGNFKVYYRISSGRPSIITPKSVGNVTIAIPYQSKSGSIETLTLGMKLNYTVSNGSATESNQSIKQNAPSTYYTQNRLITGEDYNIGPLSLSQEIVKTKSVNRTSSGISRYFDLTDPTGKYSNIEMLASDGVLFKELYTTKSVFSFNTESDIEGVIYNTVNPIIASTEVQNFYFDQFPKIDVTDLSASWNNSTSTVDVYSGFITNTDNENYSLGSFTSTNLKLIERGALLKFCPPLTESGQQQFILPDNTYTLDKTDPGASEYVWSRVIKVHKDGTVSQSNGNGAVELIDPVPTSALLCKIIPVFSKTIDNDVKLQIIDQTFAYKDFALGYNRDDRTWNLIASSDIDTVSDFAIGKQGNTSGKNLDASWLLYFKTNGNTYTITHRALRYIFESENEIQFYVDGTDRIFDPKKGKIYKDKLTVLSVNTQPNNNENFNKDYHWKISNSYKDPDGYVNPHKVEVEFIDNDNDSFLDNPDTFTDIVDPSEDRINKIIIQKKETAPGSLGTFKYFNNKNSEVKIVNNESNIVYSKERDGQIFYLADADVFKRLNKRLNNMTVESQYRACVGRGNLKFFYTHVANSNYRIDPSASNIIDTYLLTKNYDTQMRKFIKGEVQQRPLPPSSDSLYQSYNSKLNDIKSISDDIIYHPVKYKLLFGTRAERQMQVIFKIVKNKDLATNDNELKSDLVTNIERFFSTENWDFGETFYFQELSAFIMNQMSPRLLSIVIVPRQETNSFGSLFQIKIQPDEIFISAATVSDVEIIDEITAAELQVSGNIITNNNVLSSGITSSPMNKSNEQSDTGINYDR